MNDSTKAIFLSYTTQDAAAAKLLSESLRAAGMEVWFDQSALRGGDAWDAAIRRQIKACALFMPILSRHSHERDEGYFRLEWKLAVDRSHLMAADRPFLVPIVIDELDETIARVPERFREVQWTRLPGGVASAAFTQHVLELMSRAQAGSVAPTPSRPAAPPTGDPLTTVQLAAAHAAAPRPGRWVALAALVVVVLGALVWAVRGGHATAGVVPYSPEDRRMTFAVLPFEAPAGDAPAADVASAVGDAVSTAFEGNAVWDQMSPRRRVQEATTQHVGFRELGRALDAHFLVRGHVAHAPTGWHVELSVIDAESERVLQQEALDVPAGSLVPSWPDDVVFAVWGLSRAGMRQEVERVASRPEDALDVRDLTFRGSVAWHRLHDTDAKGAYESASGLIKHALAIAPDDRAALYVSASMNLCDCVNGWSKNPEEQIAIGTAAMLRYLQLDPADPPMLSNKADLAVLRGRYEDALVISDQVLARSPRSAFGLPTKATALLKLGRAKEALEVIREVSEHYAQKWPEGLALEADIRYALGDDAQAAVLAKRAATAMSPQDLANPVSGPTLLTLAAAEARLGHAERARAALADFYAAVPAVHSITAVRKWIRGNADLAGYEPLYAGLKLAGMPD